MSVTGLVIYLHVFGGWAGSTTSRRARCGIAATVTILRRTAKRTRAAEACSERRRGNRLCFKPSRVGPCGGTGPIRLQENSTGSQENPVRRLLRVGGGAHRDHG